MSNLFSRFNKLIFIVVLVILIVTGIRIARGIHKIHDMGWSLKNDEVEIEITDPEYAEGLGSWDMMDYLNAEQHLKNVLQAANNKSGEGSIEAAAISLKLGALYLDMGKYEDAYECLSSSYVTFKKELGENDSNCIYAGAMIAVYDIKTGNLERGFASLNDLYDNASYYGTKMQIAQMLAQCDTELGNYRRAIAWYDSLANLYSYFDINDSGRVRLLNDYGVLMLKVCNYQEALKSLKAASSTWEELELKKDSLIADVYSNLAMAYEYNNSFEQAKELNLKVLELQKDLHGENSIFTSMAYNTMAKIYEVEGDYEEERDCLDKALEIALDIVGENHAYTADIYLNLGEYYKKTENLTDAIDCHKQALEIRKNILDTNNIGTASVYEALSEDYRMSKQFDKGIDSSAKAIAILENLFGRENINTAYGYLTAAWIRADAGDDEAQKLAEIAIEICERQRENAGSTRPYAYQTMGYVKMQDTNYEDAIEYFEKSLDCYKEYEGENSRNTIACGVFLGDAYMHSGEYSKSFICLYSAKEKSRALKGMEDLTRMADSLLHELYKAEGTGQMYDEWIKENVSKQADGSDQ